jgi:hypothetical protein
MKSLQMDDGQLVIWKVSAQVSQKQNKIGQNISNKRTIT